MKTKNASTAKKLCLTLGIAFAGTSVLAIVKSSPATVREPGATQEAPAEPASYAQYLANAGVLVVHGETKIAFDPIFRSSFGSYLLLSEELEKNLFSGEPPFDGLDAVFLSHSHGDHFSARDVLKLMATHQSLKLFAPKQAVDALHGVDRASDEPAGEQLFDRVHSIEIDYEQDPISIDAGDLLVEAVRIPHSGWPTQMQNVENIAFRVSLRDDQSNDKTVTAAHLGDADVNNDHFEDDADYWAKRPLDVAFPPYWYLQSDDGRAILSTHLKPAITVGVHVPKQFSADDERAINNLGDTFSVFTEPLESRVLLLE